MHTNGAGKRTGETTYGTSERLAAPRAPRMVEWTVDRTTVDTHCSGSGSTSLTVDMPRVQASSKRTIQIAQGP
jgi:hypothetical protein